MFSVLFGFAVMPAKSLHNKQCQKHFYFSTSICERRRKYHRFRGATQFEVVAEVERQGACTSCSVDPTQDINIKTLFIFHPEYSPRGH